MGFFEDESNWYIIIAVTLFLLISRACGIEAAP
jgi:hypothetical protein